MGDVDLDRLADGYAHRPPSSATLRRAAAAGETLAAGSRILDVGGGPGDHAAVWAGRGHRPVVLDPSAGMLARASRRRLVVVRGRSATMPFRAGTFDLVWFHLSIHYGDWRVAVDEALRVAAPSGRIEIWTLGPDHFARSGLAGWFPSIPAIDAARFPDPADIAAHLDRRGVDPAIDAEVERVVTTAGAWLPAIEAGFVSTLQLLPADERESGIAALRRRYPDPAEEVTYDLRYTRILARIPDPSVPRAGHAE
jgi:SAM-dependent methyltransferase